jgi:hypothetical protein
MSTAHLKQIIADVQKHAPTAKLSISPDSAWTNILAVASKPLEANYPYLPGNTKGTARGHKETCPFREVSIIHQHPSQILSLHQTIR